jgi:hypothetical protein
MAQAQLDQIKEKITFTSSEYIEEVDNNDTVTTSDNHQNELVTPSDSPEKGSEDKNPPSQNENQVLEKATSDETVNGTK